MIYLDTSFVMPLFREERGSSGVARFVADRAAGELAISVWTARDVRMGVIGEAQGRATEGLGAEDFALARRYVQRYETGLRAGAALHPAIAAGRQAEAIYSLDRGMVRAGEMLGLPVREGI